ncbi:hypothetical protein Bca52824_034597 [Brassica carinata]|uniref:Uncharacterized protein n=1 Tax=Brassica carinata TaxID=52824 RepID=A0A8X7UZL4_BRACI|nr:hypothetical protein Bca52824_034597 [Brassica carinata]
MFPSQCVALSFSENLQVVWLILVSASGGGLTYSFVSQGLKVKPAHALSWAAWYAFASGTISRNAQDAFYTNYKATLSKLGLEEYEKNFKKAHLADYTLPLLPDSDLKEVDMHSIRGKAFDT